ncbi:SNW domain-containing protein 1 [Clonorchis sinensis]|uniref:SNW domain-containing protein 1 n=1 Tax=Clonorchis sinensis TaxID=79923 RepID=A0A419PTS8_CLOSI|nr:SNW domain-containing protein 1 [Clonorchis sinensis]
MGTGCPGMYAFVEGKQLAPMCKLFDLIKEMMKERYPVKTVMDKLAAQLRATRVVFGCDIMLRYFSIRDYHEACVSRITPMFFGHRLCEKPAGIPSNGPLGQCRAMFFVYDNMNIRIPARCEFLRRTDPRFVSHLTARCLHTTRKWAVRAQSGMVYFGNVTNRMPVGALRTRCTNSTHWSPAYKWCPCMPSGSCGKLRCIRRITLTEGKSWWVMATCASYPIRKEGADVDLDRSTESQYNISRKPLCPCFRDVNGPVNTLHEEGRAVPGRTYVLITTTNITRLFMSSNLDLFPVHKKHDADAIAPLPLSLGSRALVAKSTIPPYGHRKNWVPRTPEDFSDGGAFPEIHIPQFPLEMGQQKTSSNALVLKTDQDGRIRYDELVRQGHSKDRVIYSKFTDLLPKTIEDNDEDLRKPSQDVIEETTEKTRKALESLVEQKVAAAAPVRRAEKTAPAEYIRYTPTQQGLAFNSGAKQRLVRMVEMQKDPMEPPRFKINQKIPRGPPSPPPPLMHSPARKVTVKEQQDWKIPPCISNWKNPRGYTIPLDKRVAADGRGLQTVHINENFAKLAEALYTADRKAREAVEMRAQIERKVAQKQKERKEEQLQRIAHHAREFRAGLRRPGLQPDEEIDADLGLDDREELRRDRARERVRERNLARSNIETKARAQKDKERDISEQIALGLPNPRVNADGEAQFDQRLFNQSRGLDSGFSGGADDLYNVYDKPWLGDSELASHIYRPRQKDSDAYGTDLDALQKTRRFVPDREFAGADHGRRLDGPVQFERDEEDPFNLSKFLSEAKKAQKRPGENISADLGELTTDFDPLTDANQVR